MKKIEAAKTDRMDRPQKAIVIKASGEVKA